MKVLNNRFKKNSLINAIFEDADPSKIDKNMFPTKLSQVDKSLAKTLASKGEERFDGKNSDDVSKAEKTSVSANKLKSTQTTMDFGKFVGMSIQMMCKIGNFSNGAGGDLGAIISSDGHIMDGHHRWAATLMVDPSASVSGIGINLPGGKLVGVLNVWTVAHGGVGKPSDTNMDDLTPDAVAKKFKQMAEDGGGHLPSPEEILEKLKKNGYDSLEAATNHVKNNWEKTKPLRKVKQWMPPKVDMPAIEPNQLDKVKTDIGSGLMDLNPPYSSDLKKVAGDEDKEKKENRRLDGNIIVERWQKLAGLIK